MLGIGGMRFEILNDCSNYRAYTKVNDTSICILAHFPQRDVLFLADLRKDSGDYLKNNDVSKIRCDIVQLAHHGQGGADRSFYEYVHPKICLYPAPDWLYENDIGKRHKEEKGGVGTGPWKTLETRQWMAELGAEKDYCAGYKEYTFT